VPERRGRRDRKVSAQPALRGGEVDDDGPRDGNADVLVLTDLGCARGDVELSLRRRRVRGERVLSWRLKECGWAEADHANVTRRLAAE
jgi:hypothetical protein